jgi:hypothetical protein
MTNITQKPEKNQLKLSFGNPPKLVFQIILKPEVRISRNLSRLPFPLRRIVCDECCAPLYIYSENFIAAYLDPRAELPPSLCDLHLAEMESEVNAK